MTAPTPSTGSPASAPPDASSLKKAMKLLVRDLKKYAKSREGELVPLDIMAMLEHVKTTAKGAQPAYQAGSAQGQGAQPAHQPAQAQGASPPEPFAALATRAALFSLARLVRYLYRKVSPDPQHSRAWSKAKTTDALQYLLAGNKALKEAYEDGHLPKTRKQIAPARESSTGKLRKPRPVAAHRSDFEYASGSGIEQWRDGVSRGDLPGPASTVVSSAASEAGHVAKQPGPFPIRRRPLPDQLSISDAAAQQTSRRIPGRDSPVSPVFRRGTTASQSSQQRRAGRA